MKNSDLAEAFTILAKYEEDANIHAEHDEFWLGLGVDDRMSDEDVARMAELGFPVDDEGGFHLFV